MCLLHTRKSVYDDSDSGCALKRKPALGVRPGAGAGTTSILSVSSPAGWGGGSCTRRVAGTVVTRCMLAS
jgi:hypothetical protein